MRLRWVFLVAAGCAACAPGERHTGSQGRTRAACTGDAPCGDWLIHPPTFDRGAEPARFAGSFRTVRDFVYVWLDTAADSAPDGPRWLTADSVFTQLGQHELLAVACRLGDGPLDGRVVAVVTDTTSDLYGPPRLAWRFDLDAPRIRSAPADGVQCVREAAATSAGGDSAVFRVVPGERFGAVSHQASHAALAQVFGAAHVAKIRIQCVEGGCDEPGTRVAIAGCPEVLRLMWRDTVALLTTASVEAVVSLRQYGDTARGCWRTADGLGIGTTLRELEVLNQGPFRLQPLGEWDYAGYAGPWLGGRLEGVLSPAAGPQIGLRLDFISHRALTDAEYATVSKPRRASVRSDEPLLRKLNPRVVELWMTFPGPGEGEDDFDVTGYYFPGKPFVVGGQKLNWLELVGKTARLRFEAAADTSVFGDAACPAVLLSRDTLDVTCPNTVIGDVHVAGNFLDRRGGYDTLPDVTHDTFVLRAQVQVRTRDGQVVTRTLHFTFWIGE